MKALEVIGDLSAEELKGRYLGCKNKRERMRWHGLWLVKSGMNAPAVAKVVGRSVLTIRKWIRWYNQEGVNRIKARPNKGRTAWLSQEQFQAMETWLNNPAQQAGRWTGGLLKQKISEEFKIDYSLHGIYYILHRRMYRLKRPRPHHPKIDRQSQEDFKKGVWTKVGRNSGEISRTGTKNLL